MENPELIDQMNYVNDEEVIDKEIIDNQNDYHFENHVDNWDYINKSKYEFDEKKSLYIDKNFKYKINQILALINIGNKMEQFIKNSINYVIIYNSRSDGLDSFHIRYKVNNKDVSFLVITRPDKWQFEYYITFDNKSETRNLIKDFEKFDYYRLDSFVEICHYLKIKLRISNELFLGYVLMLYFYMYHYKYKSGQLKNIITNENENIQKMLYIINIWTDEV